MIRWIALIAVAIVGLIGVGVAVMSFYVLSRARELPWELQVFAGLAMARVTDAYDALEEADLIEPKYTLYKPVRFPGSYYYGCREQQPEGDCFVVMPEATTPTNLQETLRFLENTGQEHKLENGRIYVKEVATPWERPNVRRYDITWQSYQPVSDVNGGWRAWFRDFVPLAGDRAGRPPAAARRGRNLVSRANLPCVLEYYLVDHYYWEPVRVPSTVGNDPELVGIYLDRAKDRALVRKARDAECADYRYTAHGPTDLRAAAPNPWGVRSDEDVVASIAMVLDYYWVPHEVNDGVVLIPFTVSNDRELMALYSARSQDPAWVAEARESLMRRLAEP